MTREMEDNFYLLQSNLYVLALHQYLKTDCRIILIGTFGGAYYLFLRGVDPQKGRNWEFGGFPGKSWSKHFQRI